MRIKVIQKFIDIARGKKKIKQIIIFNILACLLFQLIINLKVKFIKLLKLDKKIKVAFLHMYSTDIQNVCIFEKMLADDNFDPYFIVNPDISRSKENFDFNYERTFSELSKKYGAERVLNGYDYKKEQYIDYTNDFDIMTTNNPYDNMAHKYFQIKYWAQKCIPIFYISYFYMGKCNTSIANLRLKQFNYIWKYFAENSNVLDLAKKYELIKGYNIQVTGYPKLDKLAAFERLKNNNRKKIILAPHHTINSAKNAVGCFLEYADVLLKLPQKYPEIDFVFRPHPLLLENLKSETYWGKEKTKDFMEILLSNTNITYSTEGDYLNLFAESDALIHDCGSFTAEYLYTGKPCAYLYRNSMDENLVFTEFGKECINNHYIIKCDNELYKFIDDIIVQGKDVKKAQRQKFAREKVMINYPCAAECIYNFLKKQLG